MERFSAFARLSLTRGSRPERRGPSSAGYGGRCGSWRHGPCGPACADYGQCAYGGCWRLCEELSGHCANSYCRRTPPARAAQLRPEPQRERESE